MPATEFWILLATIVSFLVSLSVLGAAPKIEDNVTLHNSCIGVTAAFSVAGFTMLLYLMYVFRIKIRC